MPDNIEKRNDANSLTEISRRSALRRIGIGATSLSLLGAGTVAAEENDRKSQVGEVDDTSSQGDGNDVEPQVMTGASTVFDPYEIKTYEDSTLKSEWYFQAIAPTPTNYYQLDILVNADSVWEPETFSTNVGQGEITKDWEYRSSSPVGAAWHWQAKAWIIDLAGAKRYVHADIEPFDSGEVEAKTGAFWPLQAWATGYLEIS